MFIFKLRRANSYEWTTVNPTLSQGEPGFEIDTGRLKIGDGLKTWLELEYFVPEVSGSETLSEHVNSELPHPVYDDGPSLDLLYENAKV